MNSSADHQSQLDPSENKFHQGNGSDGKHYWLIPPEIYGPLDAVFGFDFDPCPHPLPAGFDGLTCEWGRVNWVNPPFGSILHEGKKKGPTAWMRKAIAEQQKGKTSVVVYPIDKWVLMMLSAGEGFPVEPLYYSRSGFDEKEFQLQLTSGRTVLNLGDVRWLATEDGSRGKGTGRHIACFIIHGS